MEGRMEKLQNIKEIIEKEHREDHEKYLKSIKGEIMEFQRTQHCE